MTGDLLGRYRIEARLGAGGMGAVYRAHDVVLDRPVAIKHLHDSTGAGGRAALIREARAASALNHPGLCTIHEVGESDDRAFIVMEYVDGSPLSDLIPSGGLPIHRVLDLGIQVADALAHAHERGMVHRDLKGANIVVTSDGRAKILDFGLAQRTTGGPDDVTLSLAAAAADGALSGTPAYMAPEVLRGGPATTQSDVWSLGVLLYQMCTGRRPFAGRSAFDVAAGVLVDAPVEVPPSVPATVAAVIGRCLERNPARRYRQAGEVRAALEACQSAKTHAYPSNAGRWREMLERRRAAVAASAAVLLLLAAIAGNVGGVRERLEGMIGQPALAFAERDWLLITDFDNQTADPSFDRALNTALHAAIGQSRYVNIVPNVRIRESLRRMERPDSSGVGEVVGREIAQREGIGLVLFPVIASAGGQYVLTASLIDPATGITLRARSTRAGGRDDVLAAVDELAKDIRSDLGEARSVVAQTRPLAQVTTASFDALRLFSLGRDAHMAQEFEKARELFEEALRVDPAFTAARASLGIINVEFFDRARGVELLTQAAKAVDGLTDTERLSVLAFHAMVVEKNLSRAAEHYRAFLALRPDVAAARNNLGRVYMQMGQLDLAISELREALRLEPDLMVTYFTLASIYLHQLADYDAAIAVSRRQLARNDRSARAYGQLAMGYVGKGDLRQAETAVRRALDIDPKFALDWFRLGHILRLQTRFRDALGAFERVLEASPQDPAGHYNAAVVADLHGDRAAARRHLQIGLAESERQSRGSPEDQSKRLQLAAFLARSGNAGRAQELLREREGSADAFPIEYAGVLAVLGRRDAAFAALERAADRGFPDLLLVLVAPDLQPLQADARFAALCARMLGRQQ